MVHLNQKIIRHKIGLLNLAQEFDLAPEIIHSQKPSHQLLREVDLFTVVFFETEEGSFSTQRNVKSAK